LKRIVLKIGSSVLTNYNEIAYDRLSNIIELVAKLKENDYEVIIVSSGAVSVGSTILSLDRNILANKQAMAAIGQPLLLSRYQEESAKHGFKSAQILLSSDIFSSPEKIEQSQNTIETLLSNNVVPIINENDSVSVDELIFGDNDMLAAHCTLHFNAEKLIILSDVDGLYIDNPKTNKHAKIIMLRDSISESEISKDKEENIGFGTGGIISKLRAAKFILDNNLIMFLSSGFNLTHVHDYLIDNSNISGTIFSK